LIILKIKVHKFNLNELGIADHMCQWQDKPGANASTVYDIGTEF
jgi:hypothetical protein